MVTVTQAAVEYAAHGFALVPLGADKRPARKGWSTREGTIRSVEAAASLRTPGVGIAHAFSNTAAIDIDDFDVAEAWFRERGVELAELMGAPDAARIESGRPGRGKLLYRLPPGVAPLRTRKPIPGLELRCATSQGGTVQDALPPSPHPVTGQPYKWAGAGHWTRLPILPPAVLTAWQADDARTTPPDTVLEPVGLTDDALRLLLARRDPDCGYDEWIRVGMALHHETGAEDRGLDLWDAWSAQGEKYAGRDDLERHYESFGRGEGSQVTARSLMAVGNVADPEEFAEAVADLEAEAALEAEEPEDAVRFRLRRFGTLTLPLDPGYFVKGVLPRAGLGVIYGPSGSGKSFMVLDMLFAIARGVPWRGRLTRKARVCYVCAEGQGGFLKRLHAYVQENAVADIDDLPLYAVTDTPRLLDSADVRGLVEQIKDAGGVDLVVLDTLAQAMAGGDENSSEDMGRAIANTQRIARKTGAMVLLVHHSGKDVSKGSRGWSGLKAAADVELEVSRDGTERALTVSKLKDDEDGTVFPFRLAPVEVGRDADGDGIVSCVVQHVEEQPRDRRPTGQHGALVLEIVREHADLGDGWASCDAVTADAVRRLPPDTYDKPFRAREAIRRTLVTLQRDGFTELLDGQVRPV